MGRARPPAGLVAYVSCNKASNRIWANGTEAAIRHNKPDRLRAGFWLFTSPASFVTRNEEWIYTKLLEAPLTTP